jgi:hypothetical protein
VQRVAVCLPTDYTALLTKHFLNVIPMHFGVCLRHLHEVCGCVLLTQACVVSEITVFTHSYGLRTGACIRMFKE